MNTPSTINRLAGTSNTRSRRRGFSIIEMLVALTISGTLLTASLVALDVMFKRYNVISDSASAHVVARVTAHRIMQMIRTGSEFGPVPTDIFNRTENPLTSNSIEFVSFQDVANSIREVTRIQRRTSESTTLNGETVGQRGPFTLWLVVDRTVNGSTTRTERPLIDGVLDARFTLEYDVGPRLTRATMDLTIQPMGTNYAKFDADTGEWTVSVYDDTTQRWVERRSMTADGATPQIRLISSTRPRGLIVDE